MTRKVKIIKMPAGFAPEHIRQEWVGVEILLMNQSEADSLQDSVGWDSNEQHGGHIVRTLDAIEALKNAGKSDAANYWLGVEELLGTELRFGSEYCKIV